MTSKAIKKDLGKRLKLAMNVRGYPQNRMAKALKVHPVTMTKWIKGSSLPSVDRALLFSRELNMTLDEIFVPKSVS